MNIRGLLRSFRFAYEGLIYVLLTQRNMRIHFVLALLALGLAFIFQLSKTDILFLMFAIMMVVVTELMNTAIEKAVDLASPEWHKLAKIAKDVAAGAVLITSFFAVVVGMVIFFPAIDTWLHKERMQGWMVTNPDNVWLLWVIVTAVMILVIGMQALFARKNPWIRPSLISSVMFSMAVLVGLLTWDTRVLLIGMTMAVLSAIVLMDRARSQLASITLGACIGVLVPIFLLLVGKMLAWL